MYELRTQYVPGGRWYSEKFYSYYYANVARQVTSMVGISIASLIVYVDKE